MTRPAPDASGALQGPAPAARIPALADRAGPRPAAGGLHIHGLVRHSELPNRRRRYMSNQPAVTEPARRKFLRGAAVATGAAALGFPMVARAQGPITMRWQDRKSTRLNSSHLVISYAVFCLDKKKTRAHVIVCPMRQL